MLLIVRSFTMGLTHAGLARTSSVAITCVKSRVAVPGYIPAHTHLLAQSSRQGLQLFRRGQKQQLPPAYSPPLLMAMQIQTAAHTHTQIHTPTHTLIQHLYPSSFKMTENESVVLESSCHQIFYRAVQPLHQHCEHLHRRHMEAGAGGLPGPGQQGALTAVCWQRPPRLPPLPPAGRPPSLKGLLDEGEDVSNPWGERSIMSTA